MKWILALAMLLFTFGVNAEEVECKDPIYNVISVIKVFDTIEEMQEYLSEATGEDFSDTEAYSDCWRDLESMIAYCDIYVAKPDIVDGANVLSLGHEVVHGMCGDYHE